VSTDYCKLVLSSDSQYLILYCSIFRLKYDMTNCAFNTIMSDMSTVPFFGTSFTVYAPLLIMAICAFTLCDAYPKLLHLLGIEHEDAMLLQDQETLESKVNEGIQLLKRDTERKSIESGTNSTKANDNNKPEPRISSDKMALMPSYDDDYTMNGSCRGRYSDGPSVFV
jgi:hypothetical protein